MGRGRAIAFVANGLVSNDREIVKLSFNSKIVEKIDINFHYKGTCITGSGARRPLVAAIIPILQAPVLIAGSRYKRKSTEPQVMPPPTPSMSTNWPGLMR